MEYKGLHPQLLPVNAQSTKRKLSYVDDSQNDFADTIASAYSVRPYHIPTVSTPLDWKEINSKLDPAAFTIETIRNRDKKKGDVFENLFEGKLIEANNKI